MLSPRRAAARSLEAVSNPAALLEREQEIAGVDNPAKRAGLKTIHRLAVEHPEFVARSFGFYSGETAHYIGQGRHSNVFKVGHDSVVKVDRKSQAMSRGERRQRLGRLQYEHDALVAHLGAYALPHDIDVGPHPFEHGTKAIRFLQPFKQLDYLDLAVRFDGIDQLVADLDKAEQQYPGTTTHMASMIARSERLAEETGLRTDIVGANNIGNERGSGSLLIIDAQPVAYPGGQRLVDFHMQNLKTALGSTTSVAA